MEEARWRSEGRAGGGSETDSRTEEGQLQCVKAGRTKERTTEGSCGAGTEGVEGRGEEGWAEVAQERRIDGGGGRRRTRGRERQRGRRRGVTVRGGGFHGLGRVAYRRMGGARRQAKEGRGGRHNEQVKGGKGIGGAGGGSRGRGQR